MQYKKAVEECAIVILAWGKSVANNPRSEARALAVINLLKDHKKNLFYISDGEKDGITLLPLPSETDGFLSLYTATLLHPPKTMALSDDRVIEKKEQLL